MHLKDYLIRVDLLLFSLTLIRGYIDADQWKNISDRL